MPDMEMLDHALKYADRGWPVFSLQPREKKPLKGSRGFKDAATNEILLTRMWDVHPDANIGLATGKDAEVWVLDIDGEVGSQSFNKMETEFGPLPETLEQKTGSGGRHLFFRWPAKREVRNKQNLRPGIDIRGEGGYVVLPPSIHPCGQLYDWVYGQDTPIADVPMAWLDLISPAKKSSAPWEDDPEPQKPQTSVRALDSTPIIERAKLYLATCEPASQGSGGHNALLWAARALVTGFGLDDATAIELLWAEFNPRCVPPWNRQTESKDFDRKVGQARSMPCDKPLGWLLDEYDLRTGVDAMANIAQGGLIADALLARHGAAKPKEFIPIPDDDSTKRQPFPVEFFPREFSEYCKQSAEAMIVCPSFIALPMLCIAGVAMGNAWRLQLKKNMIAPPVLWVAIVARSGGNKTAPLKQVKSPIDDPIQMADLEDVMFNPQHGNTDVGDATTEAVVQLLDENPRGGLLFRGELAAWLKSFNQHKGGSGDDEQKWLEFWDAGAYRMSRKTNSERVYIPAAAIAILGGIQPKVLQKNFSPEKFDSGLIPRILITSPPPRKGRWTEAVVGDEAEAAWKKALMWLRTRPFKGLDSNRGVYKPRVLEFEPKAKDIWIDFHNRMEKVVDDAPNDHVRAFAAKAQGNCSRMCLIHRGLWLAVHPNADINGPLGIESAIAGTEWMDWCLAEQLRVYGFEQERYACSEAAKLYDKIYKKWKKENVVMRDLQRSQGRQFKHIEDAVIGVQSLVSLGLARWVEGKKVMALI